MSNFQRVLIIIVLCAAVIFISGILLPRYLSSQFLEFRKELNSQNNSKYNLQANLVNVSEKLIQNDSNGSISNRNPETAQKFQSTLNSSLSPAKIIKRSKRHVLSDDENFNWNFHFNLTGQRNNALKGSSDMASNAQENKLMNIAIFTEGEAKKKAAFTEIQHSLRAVEYFFSFLFNAENLTHEEESKNELARSDSSPAKFDDGSADEPSERVREGKFFNLGSLNIFGFLRSSEKSVSSSTISAVPEMESVSKRDELITTNVPHIDITENSQMSILSNFQAESLISEALNVENRNNISGSDLPGKTEDGECLDCGGVVLESPITSEITDQASSNVSEMVTSSTEFTDEFLEMFCMSLLNKVGVSQHLSDSEDLSLESKQNIIDEHALRSQEGPVFDSLSVSEKSNTESIDENSGENRNTILSENEIRQKKFLSFSSFLGFGSGRALADEDESSELKSEKIADGVDLENLPTLVHCENFFRKKNLKMFPKPNLMDIISDPKIQFADFANATISSNLIDQQIQFLTGLLKSNLDNSAETQGKKFGVATSSISSKITLEKETLPADIPKKMLINTELNDLGENTKTLITSTHISEAQQTTDLQRDGRFLSIFGFGSGNGESRSLGTDVLDTDRNEIGSGDFREFDSVGTVRNEFGSGDSRLFVTATFGTDRSELGSGDSRSLWSALFGSDRNEFGSGGLRSLGFTESVTEIKELGSDDQKSFWSTFSTNRSEFGSGDSMSFGNEVFETVINEFGRGEPKSLETTTSETVMNEFSNGNSRSIEATTFETEIGEFGSEESASLEAAVLKTDVNRFESGESRSLETVISETVLNEFSSGDLRSLEVTTFETEIGEFGSGECISFETAVLKTDVNRFESGESRSLETVISETVLNEFSSGDLRSLEVTKFETEISEFGSGESRSFETAKFETEVNEFGSDGSRSLWTETFATELNEFRNGSLRSLEVSTLDTDLNEFGSDGKSLEDAISGTEISGDMRSIETETSDIEGKEFGSGSSFKESDLNDNFRSVSENEQRFWDVLGLTGSGDGRDLPRKHEHSHGEKKCEINCSLEVTNDHVQDCLDCNNRDLREMNRSTTAENYSVCECNSTIPKSLEESSSGIPFIPVADLGVTDRIQVITETVALKSNPASEDINPASEDINPASEDINPASEDINPASEDINPASEDINPASEENEFSGIENPLELTSTKNIERFLGPIFLTGSGDGGLFGDSGGTINLIEEEESTSLDTRDSPIIEENINSEAQNIIEKPHEQTTDMNTQRFLGPIFLTGSGDGGLFEDGGGQINLLEEESTVKFQNVSLRGARLDDLSHNVSEVLRESSKQIESTIDNTNTGKITLPITPSRRGRLDDITDVHCDDCEYDYESFIQNFRKRLNSDSNQDASKFEKRTNFASNDKIPLTNENRTIVTVSSDVIRSNDPFFDLANEAAFLARPCTAARECNVTFNERCITINSSRVCGCSKGYARNKETRKCVVKKIVETSLKLPAESFEEDLKNPFSQSFQQKRKSSIEMVMLLLQNDPELLKLLTEINVVGFSAGSLVIKLNLVFAAENKSDDQLIKHVEDDIHVALRDETLIKHVPLDISEASLISVNGDIDYCKSSDLNYCSENAYCVSNPALPTTYACHCKEHFRDESFDPRHIGETCIAKCPKEYCGSYGHCEILENDERICLCSGLYFGRRCEVPGLYVLIILAFVGFISLTMLFVVIFRRKCSRSSYSGESQARETDENGMQSHMNGKVSDAIALEENIGTMKFVSISTPLPHPTIKVIRPTITESGSSYEFDSTFDSTPSMRKTDENSTV